MTDMTMEDIADAMAKIDFTMMTTTTDGGALASRPMSNNGEVRFNGDSYYFSWDSARTVNDIEVDDQVGLAFQGSTGLLGKPPIFISVAGRGRIVRDKVTLAEHWNPDLERLFPDGIDTEGMVLIHIHAERIHYWDGENEGELTV